MKINTGVIGIEMVKVTKIDTTDKWGNHVIFHSNGKRVYPKGYEMENCGGHSFYEEVEVPTVMWTWKPVKKIRIIRRMRVIK